MITKLNYNYNESHKFKKLLKTNLNDKEIEIETKLLNYNIIDYIINSDGTIDINDNVNLSEKELNEIPFKFGKVKGNFYINDNNLKNLKGSPIIVEGRLFCSRNKLITLEGCPNEIQIDFFLTDNDLITLEFLPKKIGRNIYLRGNPKLIEIYGSKEDIINYIKANCQINGEVIF